MPTILYPLEESGGFLETWPEPIGLASIVCRWLVVDWTCSVKGMFGWDWNVQVRDCPGSRVLCCTCSGGGK